MTHPITHYQAKYYAHELQRSYANDHVGKIAGLLFDAQVEPKPHQIDAALFALQTPFLPGMPNVVARGQEFCRVNWSRAIVNSG